MQETPFNAVRKREELKAERNRLFQRFLRNPRDTRLALKIKLIDDQVAACTEQIGQQSKAVKQYASYIPRGKRTEN
jgi:hypothetical protein